MRPRTRVFLTISIIVISIGAFADNKTAAIQYEIHAIRYATVRNFPKQDFVPAAPDGETIDLAMMFWLIQGSGRTILVDSGFYHERWFEFPGITDYVRPDEAVESANISAANVTDIIVTHIHWDHVGGLDLFPNATVWIQSDEFEYYVGKAWQGQDASQLGVDADDILSLVTRNTIGKLRLIDGDNVEILPGIRVYTGARHTYASQYVLVEGSENVVLASDNCGLFENVESLQAIGMLFSDQDVTANTTALKRMIELAGDANRVIPGHDFDVFNRFPSTGRIAKIH